jgi:ribonuclease Z
MMKNKPTRGLLAAALALALVAFTGLTIASAQERPSSEADIRAALFGGVPMGRWKEGLLYDGIKPQPWLKSAANWFPRTEDVQPNEMRIIFMGTAPFIRPGQVNTSIFVQLGNGENFIFDIGEGSVENYIASGFALNELDKIFITHLHIDHFGALPYVYEFGGWAGRWHKTLQVYGPSGRTPEYGTAAMIDGMKKAEERGRAVISLAAPIAPADFRRSAQRRGCRYLKSRNRAKGITRFA